MSRSFISALIAIGRDIKLAHSVFALPFALLAMFMAAARQIDRAGGLPRWGEAGLIVLCMVLARTYAMLANRYVDRAIDARNPRTAGRALPAGRLGAPMVLGVLIGCAVGLVAAAALFGVVYDNWWPVIASPIVLIWLGVYGYFKRFTAASHFFLGGALGLSPIAAALAIHPQYLVRPDAWLLGGFVVLWVGGFDIIYALQDEVFDRKEGLHSIPVKLGRTGSLLFAKAVHLVGLVLLVVLYRTVPAFSANTIVPGANLTGFVLATVIVAFLLLIEHRAASRNQFTMAFFTANGVIALMLGALGIRDVVVWVGG